MDKSSNNDEFDYFSEKISESSSKKVNDTSEVPSENAEDSTTNRGVISSVNSSSRSGMRTVVNIVVIGFGAFIGGYFGYNFMEQQNPTSAASSGTITQVKVAEEVEPVLGEGILDDEVAKASVYFTENNTFKGFKPSKPVRSAANRESIVLVLKLDNVCYSNGIAQGYDSKTRIDPTGKRCLPKNLKKLQKIMNK